MNALKQKITEAIRLNDFCELEAALCGVGYEEVRGIFQEIAFDNRDLIPYTCVCMLLIKRETAQLHYLAAEMLALPLCHIEGAYVSALYHARKAVALDPEDITLKEFLLLFHNIPDMLIEVEEAQKIAQEVLKVRPDSFHAEEILKKILKKS